MLSANGHVGSATAKELLRKGKPVTVILHNAESDELKKARSRSWYLKFPGGREQT